MNNLKTVLLLATLTGILVVIGRALGGMTGMVLALGFGLAINLGSWWFSDKIALAMSHAREVSAEDAPELHQMVGALSQQAGLPMPRVYLIEDGSPNAFATGRDPEHAAVAFTTGILRLLTPRELAGVAAHELAHIKNRDTLISTIVASVAGAISAIANMLQWAMIFGGFGGRDREGGMNPIAMLATIILAPLTATIIQLAISRAREFEADAGGARISGDPDALADALAKLDSTIKFHPSRDATPATAHMYIANPFGGGGFLKLFSTHPPAEERIRKLRDMGALATGRPRWA